MTIYSRLYKNDIQVGNDQQTDTIHTFTKIDYLRAIAYISAGCAAPCEAHHDHLRISSDLIHPGESENWNFINAGWDSLVGWTADPHGSGDIVEIDPAGQLHLKANHTGVCYARANKTVSFESTKFTIEFRMLADQEQVGTTNTIRCQVQPYSNWIVINPCTIDQDVIWQVPGGSYEIPTIVSGWNVWRLLVSTSPIPPPSVGSQQLKGWTTGWARQGVHNKGIMTSWVRPVVTKRRG